MVVAFVISAEGTVIKADIKSSTLGAAPVEGCVRAHMLKLKFPKSSGGGIVMVHAPMVFSRGSGGAHFGGPKLIPKKPKKPKPSPEEEWRKATLAMLAEDGGAPVHARISSERVELFGPDTVDTPFTTMAAPSTADLPRILEAQAAALKEKHGDATRVLLAIEGPLLGADLLPVVDALRASFPDVALVIAPWLAVLK